MRGHRTTTLVGLGALLAAGVAACGGSQGNDNTTTWSQLTRVSISARQPGVPEPPGGGPHPVIFKTPQQLQTVTNALNAAHIRHSTNPTSSNGCGGGTQIAVVITRKGNRTTKLSAYQCGGTTTGGIAGDLDAFLKRTGVSVP